MRFHRNTTGAAALVALATLCLSATSAAQFVREYDPWPVIVGGQQLALPFLGGINSPKPSLEDFDGDGLVDLLYGDGRGKITYLRNTGTAQTPNWTPAADRLGGLNTGSWFTFCDIDADGDLDLFCDALNSMTAFYRNTTVGDNIQFELVDNLYGGFTTGFNNTSDFADIDGDGDFDFFFGNASGGLDFYRNTGDAANPNFVFITAFYDSVLAFPGGGGPVQPLDPTPHDGPLLSPGLAAHGFSAIQFSDLDSDGDLDLFYGDIFNTSAYFFENRGDSVDSDLRLLTENYLPFNNQAFNHTTFGDVDGDDDPDMIIGAANAQTIDNLIFGRNEGEPGVFLEDYFIIEDFNIIKNIDVGGNGHPAFGDIDADGDQDMLLGGVSGRIALFQNTGTAVAPAFQLVNTTFGGINVGSAATPELIDWDNDNDLDLLVGTGSGYVQLWENTGSPQTMTLSLVGNLSDTTKVIKVDQWVTPRMIDLNGDGLKDLILGEWDFNSFANILVYKNVGAPGAPAFALETNRLLKREFRLFTLPEFYDWDGDGRMDLLLGSDFFGLTLYRNFAAASQFPDSLTLLPQGVEIPGTDDGELLAIRLVDIDGDGDKDVFVGEEDGGVNFYRNQTGVIARGDVDGDPGISAADITYLINYLYLNGPAPLPSALAADVDCSNAIDLADVIHLITYFYAGGPAPCANTPQ